MKKLSKNARGLFGEPGKAEQICKVTCYVCGKTEIYDAPLSSSTFGVSARHDGWEKLDDGWTCKKCVARTGKP